MSQERARRGLLRRALFAALVLPLIVSPRAWGQSPGVTTEGTEFVASLPDGRVLRSSALVGAVLTIGKDGASEVFRIDGVEPDPQDRTGTVWLHSLSLRDAAGDWHIACDPGPDGRRQGFPLAIRALADGRILPADPGVFELICTGGALGKCVRFGYHPWETDLLPLYKACVRMVRADYCGDGVGTTRNGMPIDVFDDRGIQTADNAPNQAFEAGWTENGAVCVHHTRVKENVTRDRLGQDCPRLAADPELCTPDAARRLGAVLFNRSVP